VNRNALLIGNSDGIGLATTKELLRRGWNVVGISKSASPVEGDSYRHIIASVADDQYPEAVRRARDELADVDLCIYFAGIGELLDPTSMKHEVEVFSVNLLGMVVTVTNVVPPMVARGKGHFVGLSSVADEMLSAEAPSYHASKAGFSNYLEGLALALEPTGVKVTNIRFGFVDTKMAKGDVKPFMMPLDRAVDHVMTCIAKQPVRHTAPRIVTPLVKFRAAMLRLKAR
jgi:NAD(P)-dependent dehydrogenase (short-subunit alcohol dehydrogenase family)